MKVLIIAEFPHKCSSFVVLNVSVIEMNKTLNGEDIYTLLVTVRHLKAMTFMFSLVAFKLCGGGGGLIYPEEPEKIEQ